MILYRALNDNDMKNVYNYDNIYCSLCNNVDDIDKKNILYRIMCIINKRKNLINSVLDHINTYNNNSSFWISTSSSFDEVMEKYSIPTPNCYNFLGNRKPILVMDIDNDVVFDNSEAINNIKHTRLSEFGVDLGNGLVEEDNKDVLVYGAINKKNQKFILYPLLQDIIYSTNLDIEGNLDFLTKNMSGIKFLINRMYYKFDSLFKELYPSINTCVNLTDYLKDHYNEIYGNTVIEKYNYLKSRKATFLKLIVHDINEIYYTNLKVDRLIDDKINVTTLFNLVDLDDEIKNNLLLVENNNKLYPYACPINNKVLTRKK